ncbi:hypothetical protein L484_013792 [Morus notabilis]|uniref:Uncharacterized protein n=1 Tax=Morus notabilis TaxID=981085 RepID=W9QSY5_9ROSA|nr:hypothetical protein L484_013792 [Morus notabilis]
MLGAVKIRFSAMSDFCTLLSRHALAFSLSYNLSCRFAAFLCRFGSDAAEIMPSNIVTLARYLGWGYFEVAVPAGR